MRSPRPSTWLVAPALIAAIGLIAPEADAQSDLTFSSTLTAGGVSYNTFTVTTAGSFDIWTTSSTGTAGVTPFDPVLYLFDGVGTGGSYLWSDDDSCAGALLSQCGAATFYNAIVNDLYLGVGSYTVAVGGWVLTQEEARSGVNPDNSSAGDYNLRVASLAAFGGGDGVAVPAEVVPEPATMTLLATGLAGMAAARRRKRQA